jgi:hypothetical protein
VAVELLVVGVVAGDWSEVLAEERVVDEASPVEEVLEPDAREVKAPEPFVPGVEVPEVKAVLVDPEVVDVCAVVDVEAAWLVWAWAARAAKSPTPASDPAATQPVAVRVRRSQASRREGVVMAPSKAATPQSHLSAASMARYRLLWAR